MSSNEKMENFVNIFRKKGENENIDLNLEFK